jgi:hypothetical protein
MAAVTPLTPKLEELLSALTRRGLEPELDEEVGAYRAVCPVGQDHNLLLWQTKKPGATTPGIDDGQPFLGSGFDCEAHHSPAEILRALTAVLRAQRAV